MSPRGLPPCPPSPNCVSTRAPASDDRHAIAPYRYQKSRVEAKEALKAAIATLPRNNLIEEDQAYLRYEFTSLLFRFIDDVEFVFHDDEKMIHFRSASRIGYGDFGVNRRRMEEIRRLVDGKI